MSLSMQDGMTIAPQHSWCAVVCPSVMKVVFPPQPVDDDVRAFVAAMEAWMTTVDRPYMYILDLTHVLKMS